jgi:acylphosphatase
MPQEQRRVHFSGHVQGVGFRYTVCQLAANVDVTGYVQNLRDGRVLLVAEGDASELDRLLAMIQERMQSYIASTEVESRAATNEFTDFSVLH